VTSDGSIWEFVKAFNMYDPLALVVSIPALNAMFEVDEFIVDGTAHHVIGTSAERTGVKDGAKLRDWLCAAFLEGIEQERVRSHEHATMRELRALRTEVAQLRAKRQAWLSKHVSAGASK